MANLPTAIVKQIHRECLYSGCHEPASEDSDYCAPHDAHERGRAANRQRRHRQKLADAGLCIAGCGRRVARQRRADGAIRRRRCATCRRVHTKQAQAARQKVRSSACVTGADSGVTGADPAWRADPGTNWMRFRGKGRRGRLTREEQIDEDIRDVGFARAELDKLTRALEQLKRPEVMSLPPIQREAARRELGLYVGAASRFLDELAEKYG